MKLLASLFIAGSLALPATATVVTFGTIDCLSTGCYGASNPETGATLTGLAAGTYSSATNSFSHSYPFAPPVGDFAGTDEIHVGATQTANHDGYSTFGGRVNGPLVLTLNYSSAVPAGQTVQNLTLGLALDDFQNAVWGQGFTVSVNGVVDPAITSFVNSLNQTGPVVQFFTFGLPVSDFNATNTLTISISEGGDGGDGFAVDFATVGVTTAPVVVTPEPASFALFAGGGVLLMGLLRFGRSRRWV